MDSLLTTTFLKGTITAMFAGVGGLLVILIKHSVQLAVIKNQIEILNQKFEKLESFIEKCMTN